MRTLRPEEGRLYLLWAAQPLARALWQGPDLNRRPPRYERGERPDCSSLRRRCETERPTGGSASALKLETVACGALRRGRYVCGPAENRRVTRGRQVRYPLPLVRGQPAFQPARVSLHPGRSRAKGRVPAASRGGTEQLSRSEERAIRPDPAWRSAVQLSPAPEWPYRLRASLGGSAADGQAGAPTVTAISRVNGTASPVSRSITLKMLRSSSASKSFNAPRSSASSSLDSACHPTPPSLTR